MVEMIVIGLIGASLGAGALWVGACYSVDRIRKARINRSDRAFCASVGIKW